MTTPPLSQEFADLLELYCLGELSAPQASRLEELVMGDQAHRDHYLRFVMMHAAALRFEATRPALADMEASLSELAKPAKAPGSGKFSRSLNRPMMWSVTAASVLFAAYIVTISWNMLGKKLPNGTGGNDVAVAEVTGSEDAKWSQDTHSAAAPQSTVSAGEPLRLDSGIVELQLKQGTTLLVEGPAEWTIDGDNNATLTRGKLVARVPRAAIGFTLETPAAQVIDLGTEFGVEVGVSSATEVHVLTGLVNVQAESGSNASAPVPVRAGEAVRVEPKSGGSLPDIKKTAADPDRFARQIDSRAPKGLSNKYADCVLALKPRVYLPIERNDSLTLTDHAEGKYAGKFSRTAGAGDAFEQGPFGDALRFRGNKFCDRVTIHAKDAADKNSLTFSRGTEPGLPFTIALWARCQPGQYTGLLVGKGAGFQEQYLFDVLSGKYRFVVISADRKGGGEISSNTPFDGTWQHVAAVFDPAAKSISLYVNGRLEGTAGLSNTSLFATDETTYIGNRPFRGDDNKLTIDGALDEIAIYDRALTAEEIDGLYRLRSSPAPAK